VSISLILAVLGLILLVSAQAGRRAINAVLIGALIVMLILPAMSSAQEELPDGVIDVLSVINGPVGFALNTIEAIVGNLERLYQEVVWPVDLINRARAALGSLIADFRALLRAVDNVSVRSATLELPAALEGIIRNPGTGDFGVLIENYGALYGTVPSADDVDELARNLIDVDDALALNTIKTLKASDEVGGLIAQSGDRIESVAESAAPGSAPFLRAAGLAANIQSQAMMQKMLAAMIRQEAARIAHENALRKRNGIVLNRAQQTIQDLLRRTQ
jgi:hypothetical protein